MSVVVTGRPALIMVSGAVARLHVWAVGRSARRRSGRAASTCDPRWPAGFDDFVDRGERRELVRELAVVLAVDHLHVDRFAIEVSSTRLSAARAPRKPRLDFRTSHRRRGFDIWRTPASASGESHPLGDLSSERATSSYSHLRPHVSVFHSRGRVQHTGEPTVLSRTTGTSGGACPTRPKLSSRKGADALSELPCRNDAMSNAKVARGPGVTTTRTSAHRATLSSACRPCAAVR